MRLTQGRPTFFAMTGDSDLAGIYLTVGLIVTLLAVLAAFFFVGAIAGVVLLLAAAIFAIVLLGQRDDLGRTCPPTHRSPTVTIELL